MPSLSGTSTSLGTGSVGSLANTGNTAKPFGLANNRDLATTEAGMFGPGTDGGDGGNVNTTA